MPLASIPVFRLYLCNSPYVPVSVFLVFWLARLESCSLDYPLPHSFWTALGFTLTLLVKTGLRSLRSIVAVDAILTTSGA